MKRWIALFLTLMMALGCVNASLAEALPATAQGTAVRPQDDFYAATNAELLATHATGENSGAWNWFFDLEEQAFRDQKQIIQAAVPGWGAGLSPEGKLGVLYLLATDQEGRDADGLKDFDALMRPLMEASTLPEFLERLAQLQYRYGLPSFLNIEVLAYDENPGEYVVQISDPASVVGMIEFMDVEGLEDIQAFYTRELAGLLTAAGWTEADAKKATEESYAFVKTLSDGWSKDGKNTSVSMDEAQKALSNMDLSFLIKQYDDER